MCVAPEFRATRRSFDHRSDPPRYAGSRSFDAAQPHILYRLSWLWVLLAGVGAYLLLLRTLLGTQNPNFLPSMILFGAMVVPATVLTFATTGGRRKSGSVPALWRSRRSRAASSVRSRLPHWSTTLCGHLGALPMLMVGLIEEASKIVVPTAVFLIDRRLRWPEAAVLGVASGAGFATLETMGYGFNAFLAEAWEPSTARIRPIAAMDSPAQATRPAGARRARRAECGQRCRRRAHCIDGQVRAGAG
jgi:protease PrsW